MLKYLILFCLIITGVPCLAQSASQVILSDSVIVRNVMTVTRQDQKVLLTWRRSQALLSGYYSIERKSNDRDFEVVGILKVDTAISLHQWIDEAPGPGRNAYRVYAVSSDGIKHLFGSGLAIFEGEEPIRFYPNPVENVLIIRTVHPAEVMVLDAQGQVKVPMFTVNGLFTLNVSSFEKGIYFIRFRNKSTAVVTQERLIKK